MWSWWRAMCFVGFGGRSGGCASYGYLEAGEVVVGHGAHLRVEKRLKAPPHVGKHRRRGRYPPSYSRSL